MSAKQVLVDAGAWFGIYQPVTASDWGLLAVVLLPGIFFGSYLGLGLIAGRFFIPDEYTDKVSIISRRDTPVRYWIWCSLLLAMMFWFPWMAHTHAPAAG